MASPRRLQYSLIFLYAVLDSRAAPRFDGRLFDTSTYGDDTGRRAALRSIGRDSAIMAKKTEHNYDESKIKTLSSLEHIRKRTGMYIGRIGDGAHYDDGIYVLLKEVIDNSIDEFIMGYGSKIEVTIDDSEVTVRDYGRGIPLG